MCMQVKTQRIDRPVYLQGHVVVHSDTSQSMCVNISPAMSGRIQRKDDDFFRSFMVVDHLKPKDLQHSKFLLSPHKIVVLLYTYPRFIHI